MNADWLDLDPEAFMERWYSEQYGCNAYGGAAGLIQRLMHRSLEQGYSRETFFPRVLEVGAYQGEHLKFVKHGFGHYQLSDIQAARDFGSDIGGYPGAVTFRVADVENLPWHDGEFDRVVNTCVLHHVPNPEIALRELRRVLKPSGVADIFVSGDPGMMFRLARFVGPARTARRSDLASVKALADARDHRNHVGSLLRLVQHVFRGDCLVHRSYPLRGLTWNTALWHTFRVKKVA